MICGCVGIIAEVSYEALKKRYDQGWVCEIIDDADKLVSRVRKAKANKEVREKLPCLLCTFILFSKFILRPQATSIGFHGNVVALWEKFAQVLEKTGEMLIELGSDQTSCHVPFNGGYYPVQLGFEEANEVGRACDSVSLLLSFLAFLPHYCNQTKWERKSAGGEKERKQDRKKRKKERKMTSYGI